MSYHHLSIYERGRIEELKELGFCVRDIAKRLGRSPSTISRELHRNKQNGSYRGDVAHLSYQKRRKSCCWLGKYNAALGTIISSKLLLTWSPEQIAHTVTIGKVSTKTIYNWLYLGKLPGVGIKQLRQKGKRSKKDLRGTFAMGTSIAQRPSEVENRKTFGHWELDTILSSRGESRGCFATFVERKSRLYTALKMPNRTAASMAAAIKTLYNLLPPGSFKTATTDRGKEFACYNQIQEQLGLTLYFADPYSPWQRGSNENSNGLIREFYPKKTDLARVNQRKLTHSLFLINSRPRKCLNWKSPIQVFLQQLLHLT